MALDREDPGEIELLVLPGVTLILVAAAIEPLRAANRLLGHARFRWTVSTPDGRPAPTAAGVPVPAARPFEPAASRAALFVAASYDAEGATSRALRRRLAAAGRHRPLVGGFEAGAWAIGRAGLLAGRRATTHWEDLDDFASAFPETEVAPERYVIDGPRVTSAGAGPTLDLMLELIRRWAGYPLALEVARLFSYAPTPAEADPGGVPGMALARPGEPRLARALAIMESTLDEPVPLTAIARAAGISTRHLRDLFRRRLGVSPRAHYQALRLARARRLLIETTLPVLEIATMSGFASAAAFTRAYRLHHGEAPRETRRRAQTGA